MSQTPLSPKIENPFNRALIAGALAGTTADLILFPLDTLKTRLQSRPGFQRSGGFRGVYSGLGFALAGSAPSAALFFVTYEGLKKSLALARGADSDKPGLHVGAFGAWGTSVDSMIAASAGEVAACAVRVPTEVVKQRAQASQVTSSIDAVSNIWQKRLVGGWSAVAREMYRGWGITVVREVPFTVIQFPLWEGMKTWRKREMKREVSAGESAIFGSIAGAAAAALTTPLDVLKTRMMLAKESVKVGQLLSQMLRFEGPKIFVAGIGPRVLWISSGGAIFLGSYQWAYNFMGGI